MTSSSLNVLDYVLFFLFMIMSFGIGVYHYFAHKSSEENFVQAEKQLSPVPVAMSLIASFWSATAILGYPAEVYQYGAQFWMMCIGNLMSTVLTAHLFVPKIRSLNLVSLYHYLELRFNKTTRLSALGLFLFQTVFYMSVAIFAPSVALYEVMNVNQWITLLVITLLCISYSALGGVRGVVWTDVFQFSVIIIGMITTMGLGISKVGGFNKVVESSRNSGRLNFFVFDLDPRLRHTFWTVTIGSCGMTLGIYSFNQVQVQRYLSVRSDRNMKIAIWLNLLGVVFSLTLCLLIGMTLYAFFEYCDPKLSNQTSSYNQLYPLFVMETMGSIQGLTGLFLATVCSGTLSTVSSCLNSMATVIVSDFLKPVARKRKMKINNWVTVMRLLTVLLGGIALLLTLIVRKFDFILQAALSILGVFGGVISGLFLLGFFFPWVNSISAQVGFFASTCLQLWLLVGSIVDKGLIATPLKPVSTTGCNMTSPAFSSRSPPLLGNHSFVYQSLVVVRNQSIAGPEYTQGLVAFYALSYLYQSISGMLFCVVIGNLSAAVHYLSTRKLSKVDKNLLILHPRLFAVYENLCLAHSASTPDFETIDCENVE